MVSRVTRRAKLPRPLLSAALAACLLFASCGDDDATGPPPGPEPGQLPIEPPAQLQACVTDAAGSGALTELCLPSVWNGQIVVWAHGYVNPGPNRPPYTPLALPDDEASGFRLKDIVRQLGTQQDGFYGYASTSYRRNGLVAAEAVEDLEDTAAWVRVRLAPLADEHGLELPLTMLLVGASEGGLSSVLVAERTGAASRFDGSLALCAPAGDFQRQIGWFGDFRVVWDFLFPGVMPGSAVAIPDEESTVTDANWSVTEAAIRAALDAEPSRADQLIAVTGVPYDPGEPTTLKEAATQVLRYSFMGTNDATDVLGGNPFGNSDTVYGGSDDDAALNAGVARHTADPAALASVASAFQTDGTPRVPVVVMHTTGDPVTPIWQLYLYEAKSAGAADLVTFFPVDRFGHCGFTLPELVAGFSQLVRQVADADLVTSDAVFPNPGMLEEFLLLARDSGARPVVISEPR